MKHFERIKGNFQVTSGTVPGRRHVGVGLHLRGQNNQDACNWEITDSHIAAVVCDGCSSGQASELGAILTSRALLGAVERHRAQLERLTCSPINVRRGCEEFLCALAKDTLALLCRVIPHLDHLRERAISECLLSTILASVITEKWCLVFGVGDGLYLLNDNLVILGPYPENAPPYLAHALHRPSTAPSLTLHELIPTESLSSLLLGSDGAADIFAAQSAKPSSLTKALWSLSRAEELFGNRDRLRRSLVLLNSLELINEDQGSHLAGGALPDDTTLIAIRRRPSKDSKGSAASGVSDCAGKRSVG